MFASMLTTDRQRTQNPSHLESYCRQLSVKLFAAELVDRRLVPMPVRRDPGRTLHADRGAAGGLLCF